MPDSPRFVRLAAFASMLLAAAPALAEDWRVAVMVESSPEFGRSIGFVDRDSVSRQGDLIDFVYEVRFERARMETLPLDAMRISVHADCAALWYEIAWIEGYSGSELAARTGSSPRREADEGSNVHGVLVAACRDAYQSETVNPAAHSSFIFGKTVWAPTRPGRSAAHPG